MDTTIIHPYNRINQPTPAHELAATIISPICYRRLLTQRWWVQDGEDILYSIPEIEEKEDEEYVVLNVEEAVQEVEDEEDGLIEVLITIEANVDFEIDSILTEDWSIVDEVSLVGEDDLVFVNLSLDDEDMTPTSLSRPIITVGEDGGCGEGKNR